MGKDTNFHVLSVRPLSGTTQREVETGVWFSWGREAASLHSWCHPLPVAQLDCRLRNQDPRRARKTREGDRKSERSLGAQPRPCWPGGQALSASWPPGGWSRAEPQGGLGPGNWVFTPRKGLCIPTGQPQGLWWIHGTNRISFFLFSFFIFLLNHSRFTILF